MLFPSFSLNIKAGLVVSLFIFQCSLFASNSQQLLETSLEILSSEKKPYTVMVILEAVAGKEQELEEALKAVVEPSRNESTCLSYHLHKSVDNPGQFGLYETWVSKEKHQEQFSKPYIIDLVAKLEGLVSESYHAIYAEEL